MEDIVHMLYLPLARQPEYGRLRPGSENRKPWWVVKMWVTIEIKTEDTVHTCPLLGSLIMEKDHTWKWKQRQVFIMINMAHEKLE